MDRVAIIGAGHVGATAAFIIAQRGLADVVMVDIAAGLAKGKALDQMQAMAIHEIPVTVRGTDDFSEIAGSELVVITAGFPRGPGMSRDDLLQKNGSIIESVVAFIKEYAPGAIIMTVTNPLDEMTTLTLEISGLPRHRVLGMGGVLDSGRFTYFITDKFKVSPESVKAMVIGAHGDKMVPLVELATIDDQPISNKASHAELEELIDRTRKGGAEIIAHLEKGSAYYGPGAGVAKMVEAVLKDTNETLPCSVYLEGEYGLSGVCLGAPAVIGRDGVTGIIDVPVTDREAAILRESADDVRFSMEAWHGNRS